MFEPIFRRALCAATVTSCLLTASASEELVTLQGVAGTEFGASIAVLGDWNGDGHDEYVVGIPGHSVYGSIRVVNGADHETLWSSNIIFGTGVGPIGASVADAGDFDGDGYGDIIVGRRGGDGYILVLSGEWIMKTVAGETPTTPLVFFVNDTFGGQVLLGGLNMNNDGVDDILVGNPDFDMGSITDIGIVVAFSGATFQPFGYRLGESAGDRLGASLGKLGPKNNYDPDVDLQEYLVGAPGADKVYVLEGGALVHGTLAVLAEIDGSLGSQFGASIAVIGDTSGDGKDEFIVGAPKAGLDDAGEIVYFSSEAGSCTSIAGTHAGQEYGTSLAATGDLNLDDLPDFIVSGSDGSGIFIYSGADCSLAGDPITGFPLTSALAGGGDVNNDGLNDIFIGSPSTDTAAVFSSADLVVPAFVDRALLVGMTGAPATHVEVRYPTHGLDGQVVVIDIDYDHGAGFLPGSSELILVPVDAAPQLEYVTTLGSTGAFVPYGTYRYRTRSYPLGGAPGSWSEALDAHTSADRNGDWWIDVIDLGMCFGSLGTDCGEPGFDPLSDFNGDCTINVEDLGIWATWRTIINML